jgi:uracil-DNA glycosylase
MINTSLTVREWEPMSHSKIWREIFTDNTIKKLSKQKKWLIFILWGAFAQAKKQHIDITRHFILESTHPSPFSAHRGFFWSNPFSKINQILRSNWQTEINRKL